MAEQITTLKLRKKTKKRLDKLREYKRETYDEILEKMLEILTVCRLNPERARSKLVSVSRKQKHKKRKEIIKPKTNSSNHSKSS